MMTKDIVKAALAGIITLGGSGAYAARQVAQSNSIGEENALNFACIDAGTDPADVQLISSGFERENGIYVYDLEFKSDEYRYDYTISASDGTVIEREKNLLTTPAEYEQQTASADTIGLDEAKAIALKKAGVSANEAVFTETKMYQKKGVQIYEIEFETADRTEYEFEINALTGEIMKEESGSRTVDDKTASDGSPASSGSSQTISVDEAKESALKRAGLSAGSVTFFKAKLEHDDGRLIYDVEFYDADGNEYDYEIDAYTGKVLAADYDVRDVADDDDDDEYETDDD